MATHASESQCDGAAGLTGVNPAAYVREAATPVTVTGSGFTMTPQAIQVSFGGDACESVTLLSSSQISCIPSNTMTGVVSLSVVNGNGASINSGVQLDIQP